MPLPGLISYRAYWKDVILHYLEKYNTDSKVNNARKGGGGQARAAPVLPRAFAALVPCRGPCRAHLFAPHCKVSISRMSEKTGINTYDIISTLQSLGMVKYWRGKHVLLPQPEVEAEHRKRSRRRGIAAGTPGCGDGKMAWARRDRRARARKRGRRRASCLTLAPLPPRQTRAHCGGRRSS